MCIYTFKPLKRGQDIVFKSDLPVPHHRATVKWVKQFDRSIYKVGVRFTSQLTVIPVVSPKQPKITLLVESGEIELHLFVVRIGP